MTEERDRGEFEELPLDVRLRMAELDAKRVDSEWHAFNVWTYSTGQRTVAVLCPQGFSVGRDFRVFHGQREIEWTNSEEAVTLWLENSGNELRFEWGTSSALVIVEDLP